MNTVLYLMIGGAVGTLSRYFLALTVNKYFPVIFPLGTLVVNSLGCFMIGVFWGLGGHTAFSINMRAFLFVGIMGGFTTMSTFSIETMNLFHYNEFKLGILNIFATNIICLLFTAAGFFISKACIGFFK